MTQSKHKSSELEGETLKDRAEAAHRRGDYVTALELYKKLAALGSDVARYDAANIMLHGWGEVKRDPIEARIGYEQVLRSNNPYLRGFAAVKLGQIYEYGLGIPVDYERAFSYYKRLEDTNDAVGLLRLGIFYEQGQGTPKDLRKAMDLYRRAAQLGHVFGRRYLGVLKVKTGSVPTGLLLWSSALLQGIFLGIFRPKSQRIRIS